MSFFVYFIVLLISVGSVIFGADWLQAPMTPMAPSRYELHAAKPPPQPAVQQAEAKAPDVTPSETTDAQAQASASATPVVAANQVTASPPPSAVMPQPAIVEAPVAATEPPKCDIAACERAYRSFTPSDCTYQPSDGPRRLCTKGTPPAAASSVKPDARAQASCNIAACSDAYISFSASDCTYQPSDGPRRLCTK
ncbi:MAG: BA14K family protein [Proteobacteria bacterium]|nr:BA14K family protein [Pseudomonadota bacterium]